MLKRGQLITAAVKSGAILTNDGALCVYTSPHTGRSPNAKKIVLDKKTSETVDWKANSEISEQDFQKLKERCSNYMLRKERRRVQVYRQTVLAGKDPKTAILVEIICERPEHALFVQNMFTPAKPSANPDVRLWSVPGMEDEPIVAMDMTNREIIISGTQYAGEIKKSVFTYLNFIYPELEILPMHCSVNTSLDNSGNTTIFFGLSGTGKTTLSADTQRRLIGDDEHGWGDNIVFNFENGCYAKTIGLTEEEEPEIYRASRRYGAILENVTINNSDPNFDDTSITLNGRASYPLTHIPNIVEGGVINESPSNIIMLTCDAFGVLPAVCRLTEEEAEKQFLLGYTAKVAGTEVGIAKPQATFSPCFGAPFMPRRPSEYGKLLKKKIKKAGAQCWLVNTGWFGGPPGLGRRIDLNVTRKIVQMINDGSLTKEVHTLHEPTGFIVPSSNSISHKYTQPHTAWESNKEYEKSLAGLLKLMSEQKSE